MTEQDYENLWPQIRTFDIAFDEFALKHNFSRVSPLGRYPQIRIERVSDIVVWFDMQMALTPTGRYYERLFDDMPYDLGAGATLDVRAPPARGIRYHTAFFIWEERPFPQISTDELLQRMEEALPRLNEWDAPRLRALGSVVTLAGR